MSDISVRSLGPDAHVILVDGEELATLRLSPQDPEIHEILVPRHPKIDGYMDIHVSGEPPKRVIVHKATAGDRLFPQVKKLTG